MVGIVIGVATAVPTAAAVIFISFAKLNDAMQQRSATWRKFFDGFNDEDDKKAPAGATAGTENFTSNQIYPSIVSNRLGIRKVETK